MNHRMLTVKQVAERLKVSTRFVYRHCASGSIDSYSIGSTIRISESALDDYLASCTKRLHHPQQPKRLTKPKSLSVLKLRGSAR